MTEKRPITRIEWTAGGLGFAGWLFAATQIPSGNDDLLWISGLLFGSAGLLVAFNVQGIASTLGERRVGFGPFWQQQSAASWRLMGGFLAVIGVIWVAVSLSR